jgi:hypothetical protein
MDLKTYLVEKLDHIEKGQKFLYQMLKNIEKKLDEKPSTVPINGDDFFSQNVDFMETRPPAVSISRPLTVPANQGDDSVARFMPIEGGLGQL